MKKYREFYSRINILLFFAYYTNIYDKVYELPTHTYLWEVGEKVLTTGAGFDLLSLKKAYSSLSCRSPR